MKLFTFKIEDQFGNEIGYFTAMAETEDSARAKAEEVIDLPFRVRNPNK